MRATSVREFDAQSTPSLAQVRAPGERLPTSRGWNAQSPLAENGLCSWQPPVRAPRGGVGRTKSGLRRGLFDIDQKALVLRSPKAR